MTERPKKASKARTPKPLAQPAAARLRVGIITLGCDKNTVDNEYLAGLLAAGGCEVVAHQPADGQGLDAVVVTTCGFLERARQQSVEVIVELADRKRRLGDPKRLYVAGCLAQRYAGDLVAEIPEIDGLVGVGQFKDLARMILESGSEEQPKNQARRVPKVRIYEHLNRQPLEAKPYAFLKISDGCNHGCTFCSIPLMKGRMTSVEPEILLAEARDLLARGVREINLVAQDLSAYGTDLRTGYRLPALLRDLCALEGDFWVRCLYVYPGGVTGELIATMASEPKILPYLDLPLQHLDPGVLRRMKRPFREVNIDRLAGRLREAIPGLTLRSTMIVGFPGETRAEFEALLRGVKRLELDRLGAFEYSEEESTPAAGFAPAVDRRTRRRRWHRLMAAQAEVSARLNQRRVGQHTRVLVEGWDPGRQLWYGRSPAEAPEVDGKVFVQSRQPLNVGQWVVVQITAADTYDLTGCITG